jgi:hypothetical protein
MAHKIKVAVIGSGALFKKYVMALYNGQVLLPENLLLCERDKAALPELAESAVHFYPDASTAVVKSDLVIVCGSKQEMATALAPVCGCTGGRILLAVCTEPTEPGFILERVAVGTDVVVAPICQEEESTYTEIAFSPYFPLYYMDPCRDLLRPFCQVKN